MAKHIKRTGRLSSLQGLPRKAMEVFQVAVSRAIEEHRLLGHPIFVWEKNRVVRIPASQITPLKQSR